MAVIRLRLIVWAVTLMAVALLGGQWLFLGLSNFQLRPIHAPIEISAVLALIMIFGFQIFAIRPGWRCAPFALIGLVALLFFGFSLRSVGDHIFGAAEEHWAGGTIREIAHPSDDDYCSRMDGWNFEVRGVRHGNQFTYWRGIWPTAFSEEELRTKFAPFAIAQPGGWSCPPGVALGAPAQGSEP